MSSDLSDYPQKYKGSQALLKTLEKNQVQTIFGYPGGVLLGLYDQIYAQDKIRHILVRHEQASAHAADAYTRIAGKPGVCLATSGPGATNLLTGICSAQMDSIPMIALTGQVPTNLIGKDGFQEADLFNLSIPITKHSYQVRETKRIPQIVDQAFKISKTGRGGVVLVDLPKDILNSDINWSPQDFDFRQNTQQLVQNNSKITDKEIDQAVAMILDARKPVLYIGGGVSSSRTGNLIRELSENSQIPIVWTLMGKGSIDDCYSLNLGMLGMHGTMAANYAVHESDLLIAVGVRFDDRATGKLAEFAPKAKVLHIDIDPAEIGKNRKIIKEIDLSIVGDAKKVLPSILLALSKRRCKSKDWLIQNKQWQSEYPLDQSEDSNFISPSKIFKFLNQYAKDAVYTTDVGQHQMWAAQYLELDNPANWITSGGLGTMGFGLPAALGAKVALQDLGEKRPVVCITGDGGFQMNQQELATIKAHNLAIVVIIINNGNLGMVRQWQSLFFEEHYSCSHFDCSPDFVKLSEAFGIKAQRISKAEELEEAIKGAFDIQEAVVLDIIVHPEVNVFPIVPPGQANKNAIGASEKTTPENRSKKEYLDLVEKALVYQRSKNNSQN